MSLVAALRSRWSGLLLRGILAVAVGLLALFSPVAAVVTLAMLFACFVIAEGVLAVAAGLAERPKEWALVVMGAIGVLAGVVAASDPARFALTLVMLIGLWAIFRGLLEIWLAIRLRRELRGEGWLMLSGAFSVALGVLLLAQPLVGVVAHGVLFGIYALVAGLILIALALKLRRLPKH